jgi:hypothetical protein
MMRKILFLLFLVLIVLSTAPEASFAWGSWWGGRCVQVPEPSTLILLGSGIAGLVVYGRKHKK